MKRPITIILTMWILGGCYYDNEAILYPASECDVQNVTYAETIAPIISSNCLGCHSAAANNGGITLEGYNALKTVASNGKLIGVVTHASGFSPMPKNSPQLRSCDIEKIKAWISSGALNN